MTPATAEEQAELRVLHQRAVETGREVSQTAAALAGRLTEAASPRQWARSTAGTAGARARQAARRAAARPLRVRARAPKLAATVGVLALVALAVTWQHHATRS